MKKIFFAILPLLSAIAALVPDAALADNVPQEQARKIAEQFFASKAATRVVSSDVTLKWTGTTSAVQTIAQQTPAFYVFDNPAGGFVVVAGDDCVEPILGYSTEGSFQTEGMPDNVKYWFDNLNGGIAYLRAHNIAPSAAIRTQWLAAKSGSTVIASTRAGSGKLLETAKWNQTDPFNLKASEWCNFGGKVYTGCVATATAIIMRYHQHPQKGSGTLDGYEYTSDTKEPRTVRGYQLGHTYDWTNMPTDNGRSNWTTAQKNAVSQLMLDCGVMCTMAYGVVGKDSGSGAVSAKAPSKLVEHMDYDLSHDSWDRSMYPRNEWVAKIMQNIDDNCPVLLSGRSAANDGHAFILDGYDADGKIHVNFGWGGSNDAYYAVPDFGAYSEDQTAYVDIKPNAGGSAPATFIYQSGMKFSKGPIVDAQTGTISMTVQTERLGNGGSTVFKGQIYLAHADKDNNIKATFRTVNATSLGTNSYYPNLEGSYTAKITEIFDGDKIKWFYKLTGSDSYMPVRPDLEAPNAVSELPMPGLAEIFDMDENTSVEYLTAEKKLVISTHTGVKWTLKSSSGADITTGVSLDAGVITIDLNTLGADTYTLTMNVGSLSRELQFSTSK